MNNQDWIERWRQGETGFHQLEVNRYLCDWWQSVDRASSLNVFVPLCGKSLDLLWLSQRCKTVTGVEVSEQAVEEFFAEHNLVPTVTADSNFNYWEANNIKLICGDFFKLPKQVLADINLVYDRAALIALNKELRHEYIAHLLALLPTKAEILLIALSYDQEAMAGPPYSVSLEEVQAHFDARFSLNTLFSEDVLEANSRFADKGLNALQEFVLHLEPR